MRKMILIFTFSTVFTILLSACSSPDIREEVEEDLAVLYEMIHINTSQEEPVNESVQHLNDTFEEKYIENKEFELNKEEEELYLTLQNMIGANLTMYSSDDSWSAKDSSEFYENEKLYLQSDGIMRDYFPELVPPINTTD